MITSDECRREKSENPELVMPPIMFKTAIKWCNDKKYAGIG